MTTFSDPGFRVSGPGDDPSDEDVETEVEAEVEVDVEVDVEVEDEAETETEVSDEAELDEAILDELETEFDDDEPNDDEVAEEPVDEAEELVDDDDVPVEVEQAVETDVEVEADEAVAVATEPEDDRSVEDSDEVPTPVEEPVAQVAAPAPQLHNPLEPEPSPFWSMSQLLSVGQRALAVLVVMGVLGYGLGALRGSSHTARTEFVYTLDESVPDSFLREDRRLLTQVVTFKSDAVLTPVATEFDMSVDQLRSKIDVETLNMSEVLRLDVTDADEGRAIALSQAVLNQYLQVITDASVAGDSTAELAQRRADVATELETADTERESLLEATQQDIALEVRQASIQRQIDLRNEQLNRLQSSIDEALVQGGAAARRTDLSEQYDATLLVIEGLEADLIEVGSQRAALSSRTTAEPAVLREIDRLESILTTIDDELSQRELAPLVASPIRELSEPITLFRSRNIVGLQGMALGLMAGLPLAALVAYRTRKRQLWFD